MPLPRTTAPVLFFVVAGLCASGWLAHALPRTDSQSDRAANWNADLDAFSRTFAANQLDFAKLYPRVQFEQDLAAIRQSIATSSDAQISLSLMRLVAAPHVGHVVVRAPQGSTAFHRLPLGLSWYSDGLCVTAASDAYKQALGARVVRIGTMTPAQVEAAVAPYIAYETEGWLHQQSPAFMVMADLLQRIGVARADGAVEIALSRPGSGAFTIDVAPVDGSSQVVMRSAADELHLPAPLYRKNPGRSYWYEYLADARVLYVQYNRCANDAAQSFADFAAALFAFVDGHPVDRTIVDLRSNQGGDSRVIAPLINGLKSRKGLSARGRLYALTGRATFSSGLMAALSLRNELRAVLIGEPPGELLNSYGEVRTFGLPNSNLQIQYTQKFFRFAKRNDPSLLTPDVMVARSMSDWWDGRDPVLEAALGHPIRES